MIPPSDHLGQFLCFISKCGTLTAQPQVVFSAHPPMSPERGEGGQGGRATGSTPGFRCRRERTRAGVRSLKLPSVATGGGRRQTEP